MIDVHPASDDRYRLWSHLTKAEGRAQVHTKLDDRKRKANQDVVPRKRKRSKYT